MDDSNQIHGIEWIKINKWFFISHPVKPLYLDLLQKFYLFSNSFLGKNEDPMPSSCQLINKINQERSLEMIIGTRWKRRGEDADVQFESPITKHQ